MKIIENSTKKHRNRVVPSKNITSPSAYSTVRNVRDIRFIRGNYKAFRHIAGHIFHYSFFLTGIKILRSHTADGAFFDIEYPDHAAAFYGNIPAKI